MKYKNQIQIGHINIHYNNRLLSTSISEVRRCFIKSENSEFEMLFDERFNEIDFVFSDKPQDPFDYENQSAKYLKIKFNELKSKDFRYKSGSGYEGTKTMYLEDFIQFLKSENRNLVLNEILKES